MSHPLSIAALRSGKLEVKNYAAIVPYNYEVLANPDARQLLTSYDVMGGEHTTAAMWATEKWVKANPKTYEAVVAAFEEAMERIAADPKEAARIYVKREASTLKEPDVVRIITNPKDIRFSATPNKSLQIAETMYKIGLLKHQPKSWTDYFHSALHGKNGS
jgi:NitT/TauT family transport system substrate-binding protein